MSTAVAEPFELLGPLPARRLAIEASAGTGKTYALAALATRFLAETDVTVGELLVVTFTRAATTELRARVRARLAEAAAHLAHPEAPKTDDALLRHLAGTDRDWRRQRLERALAEFDAATISTIHGFATQVLATIGASGGVDPDLALVDDGRDLVRAVCADVLTTASVSGCPEAPSLNDLTRATHTALMSPDLVLQPGADQEGVPERWQRLAELVPRALDLVAAHRHRHSNRGFADVLTDLRRALSEPATEAAAVAALQSRYQVALIDEFQDTDPVQWDIFSSLFGPSAAQKGPDTSLVLVGDPKQAIYAFRGADVHTYVRAVSEPDGDIRSLATNHRSDGAALAALTAVFDGVTFGDPSISFAEVSPTEEHRHRRLTDASGRPLSALSLRLAIGDDIPRGENKPISVDNATDAVWSDLTAQVRHLLDHAHLPASPSAPPGTVGRRVRPSDIAVLVKRLGEAQEAQERLIDQGIPAVLARGASVLQSPAAEQWRWLLDALARPSDPARARTFALSWFGGRDAEWVASAADEELAALQDQLRSWAESLSCDGVTSLLRHVWSDSGVTARMLRRPDGDRAVTDLEHLAELFRTQAPAGRSSVAGLLAMLDTEPFEDADAEREGNLASRRVESEAEAVQVMTAWVAKGLEFPITCCPTMWRNAPSKDVIYEDADLGGRAFDLAGGKDWPDKKGADARKQLSRAESDGEDLRLLYVALTRAQHQTLLWWSCATNTDGTALTRLLFARRGGGHIDPDKMSEAKVKVDDATAADRLAVLAAKAPPGVIDVGTHGRVKAPESPWIDPSACAPRAELAIATLDRPLDRSLRRWSYTAIARQATTQHHHDVDEPGDERTDRLTDEPVEELPDDDATTAAAEPAAPTQEPAGERTDSPEQLSLDSLLPDPTAPSPLAALAAGAAFGNLVHAILEEVPFDHPDLRVALRHELGRQLSWRRVDLGAGGDEAARAQLVDGLVAVIETPLGPSFAGRPLRSLTPRDRLAELSFELHLGEAGPAATDRDLGRLVLDHLPDHDPFRLWAAGVADGAFDVDLAGHLNGSIDLVARVADPDRAPRYVIADYKTNRLHPRGAPPGPDHYRRASMVAEMGAHHYPLQALLYSVALHRYLRWRQPGYHPAHHLGGAAYLFVRGMSGPHTPAVEEHVDGVCSWAIPPNLVTALSDLLHGRRSAR